jgi:hypothetical protein
MVRSRPLEAADAGFRPIVNFWTQWARHFGPLSGSEPNAKNLAALSTYQTRQIKRFGDYVYTVTTPEPFDRG